MVEWGGGGGGPQHESQGFKLLFSFLPFEVRQSKSFGMSMKRDFLDSLQKKRTNYEICQEEEKRAESQLHAWN